MIKFFNATINTFDLADYIIDIHNKNNITLSLNKLHAFIFFYQIASKTLHIFPPIEDDILIKNDFVFLADVEHKYRKYKKEDIAKLKIKKTLANFCYFGSACKFLTQLTFYFENYSDALIKKLIHKMPIYEKRREEKIITMVKKDFAFFYPLKKWEDVYNMIIIIDDAVPLFIL